jgi:hypothetical protein
VIEISKYDFTNPTTSQIYNHLVEHHYRLIGYVVVNAYFVAQEQFPERVFQQTTEIANDKDDELVMIE